jgi:hypothetical protein
LRFDVNVADDLIRERYIEFLGHKLGDGADD